MVDAGHGEGSPQTDGEPLERRLPGRENIMLETGPLLSLLQDGQPTSVSAVKSDNIRGLQVVVFSKGNYPYIINTLDIVHIGCPKKKCGVSLRLI